jgi:hypothetical protein
MYASRLLTEHDPLASGISSKVLPRSNLTYDNIFPLALEILCERFIGLPERLRIGELLREALLFKNDLPFAFC